MNPGNRIPPSTKGRKLVKIGALTQAKLIKLMLEGTRSCQELADETGLHYVTVLDYTKYLHREGAAHVCEFRQDSLGRDAIKVYKIGVGKDAKRFKMTGAQRQARSRENKRGKAMHAAMMAIVTAGRHEETEAAL